MKFSIKELIYIKSKLEGNSDSKAQKESGLQSYEIANLYCKFTTTIREVKEFIIIESQEAEEKKLKAARQKKAKYEYQLAELAEKGKRVQSFEIKRDSSGKAIRDKRGELLHG